VLICVNLWLKSKYRIALALAFAQHPAMLGMGL